MVGRLRRVMVCAPREAGWRKAERVGEWKRLGYQHAPDFAAAQAQHEAMRRELEAVGAEVIALSAEALQGLKPPRDEEKGERNVAVETATHKTQSRQDGSASPPSTALGTGTSGAGGTVFSMDAVYVHDASLMTDRGAICLRMGKPARNGEPAAHAATYRSLGIPVQGEVTAPGIAEAGDMVWLDERTLLVGRGYRTNSAGIEQLREMLGPKGVEVISAPLPHGGGPAVCLHLMSLMSVLDERTVLVDMEWLAVETVEMLQKYRFRFIEIDAVERATLACNVVSLGGGRLLALEENAKTNARLRAAGFDVRTFLGSELAINGGGGPTCLTRPTLREKS